MAKISSQNEILIAVIGVTGAGKTTFISKATGRSDLKIGHGIDSCTQQVEPVTLTLDGKKVTLIDTPGFDDTYLSDADILNLVADFMARTYSHGIYLTGLILLQPINVNRLQGNEMKRTRLFKKILGEDAYGRVVVATTMWDQLPDSTVGQGRSDERTGRNDVWGDMVSRGAKVVRHEDNQRSTFDIIRRIMKFSKPVALQIQTELEKNGGRVSLTSAGKQLDADLGEQINKLKQEIEELRRERDATREEFNQLQQQLQEREDEKANLGESWVQVANMIVTTAKTVAQVAAILRGTGACAVM